MNNPDSYRKTDLIQRSDKVAFLKEYQSLIDWRSDGSDSLLDIGCAGGDLTVEQIQKIMPKSFKRLVGADINDAMINYASTHFARSNISFTNLDIGGDISTFLENNEPFDHITILNCLHLVPDQKQAFDNIFKLLNPNGDILIYTLADNTPFNIYARMFNNWSEYMEDIDDYVSCFYKRINPVHMLKRLIKNAGFSKFVVKERLKTFIYDDTNMLAETCKSFIPFYNRIPDEKRDEFMQEFIEHAIDLQPTNGHSNSFSNSYANGFSNGHSNGCDKEKVIICYKQLEAYARK